MNSTLVAIQSAFWNTNERRLRALWRIVLQTLTMVGIGFVLMTLTRPVFTDKYSRAVMGPLIVCIAASVSIWLACRFIDRRPLSDLGLTRDRNWWIDLAFGLFLGAFEMTAIFAVQYQLDWLTIEETFYRRYTHLSFFSNLAPALVAFLCVGFYEEFLSRGYHLKNVAEGAFGGPFGQGAAVAIAVFFSSVLFGLGHAFNPNASHLSTLILALTGISMATGYIITGRLALPIGLHITWNFFQGPVFGFAVSGTDNMAIAQFFHISQQGPDLWTGAEFGPEGGILGLIAVLFEISACLAWCKFRYGSIRLHPNLVQPPLRLQINETEHASVDAQIDETQQTLESEQADTNAPTDEQIGPS